MEKKSSKKNSSWRRYVPLGFPIVIGFFVGIIGASQPDITSESFATVCIRLEVGMLIVIVAAFLQMIIHETGHLVFGLLSGYGY